MGRRIETFFWNRIEAHAHPPPPFLPSHPAAYGQHSETRPYVEEVLENLQETVADLAPTQLQGFYEAVG